MINTAMEEPDTTDSCWEDSPTVPTKPIQWYRNITIFPAAVFSRWVLSQRLAKKVEKGTFMFLAAVIQYLTREILETAGHVSDLSKVGIRKIIKPLHIKLAIKGDEEL